MRLIKLSFHLLPQGGLAGKQSRVPMTAYVLISLLESGISTDAPFVVNSIKCILSDSSNDPYGLALKAYALALAQHTSSKQVLQELIDSATIEENLMHWDLPKGIYLCYLTIIFYSKCLCTLFIRN